MTQSNASEPAVGPRHRFYVSLTNGGIYPAMSSPPGHEDANPTDWRGATPQEEQRYLQGEQAVDVSPVPLTATPLVNEISTPTTLQLEPDDPVVPAAPVIPLAAVAEAPLAPPVAPAAPIAPASPAPALVTPPPPAPAE